MSDENTPPVDNVAPDLEVVDDSTWQKSAGLDGNPSFEKFDSVGALAKSYTELERYNSGSLRIPTDDASPEVMTAFLDKVSAVNGVTRTPDGYIAPPEEATGYEFGEVEGFAGDESVGELKVEALKLGMTNAQADGIHKWLAGNIVEQSNTAAQAGGVAMAELKGLWGNAFDRKMTEIENVVTRLDQKIPGIKNAERTPEFLKMMDLVGEALGESGNIQNDPRITMTPEQASQRLGELAEANKHLVEGDAGWNAFRSRSLELYHQGGRINQSMSREY